MKLEQASSTAQLSDLIDKVRNDPQFFIENFLQIQPKGKPLCPFILNPSQKIVVDIVKEKISKNEPIRLVICKNRQCGMSTLTEALVFWATVTNPSYHSLLVAPSRPRAQSLFEISNTFYESLPTWFKPLRKYKTKDQIIFEQPNEKLRTKQPGLGSSIRITPAKDLKAPRGLALSCAHLSEVPSYDEYMDEFYPALSSAIPEDPRTLIIMESTPLGRGGYFYDTYMRGKYKDSGDPEVRAEWNNFEAVFIPWMIDPNCSWPKNRITQDEIDYILSHLDKHEIELMKRFNCDVYQLKWRRNQIQSKCNNNIDKFRLENPATEEEAFSLSGSYFFTEESRNYYERIQKDGKHGFFYFKGNPMLQATTIEFKESKDTTAPVEIFEMPRHGEEYVMGVDPAYGMERDYSAALVLNKDLKVCATFYSNTTPIDEFTDEVVKVGKFYNEAKLNLETTGAGNGMMFRLRKMYKNWWLWEKWDSPQKRRKLHSIGFDATNRSVSAIDNLLTWVFNTKILKTTSIDLVTEMLSYQYNQYLDRGMASSTSHDDLMRALGLALLAIEDLGSIKYQPTDNTGTWIKPDYGGGPDHSVSIGGNSGIFPDWLTSI